MISSYSCRLMYVCRCVSECSLSGVRSGSTANIYISFMFIKGVKCQLLLQPPQCYYLPLSRLPHDNVRAGPLCTFLRSLIMSCPPVGSLPWLLDSQTRIRVFFIPYPRPDHHLLPNLGTVNCPAIAIASQLAIAFPHRHPYNHMNSLVYLMLLIGGASVPITRLLHDFCAHSQDSPRIRTQNFTS